MWMYFVSGLFLIKSPDDDNNDNDDDGGGDDVLLLVWSSVASYNDGVTSCEDRPTF